MHPDHTRQPCGSDPGDRGTLWMFHRWAADQHLVHCSVEHIKAGLSNLQGSFETIGCACLACPRRWRGENGSFRPRTQMRSRRRTATRPRPNKRRARAIFAAVAGAQLMARSRSNSALSVASLCYSAEPANLTRSKERVRFI
jgi:hypothetical protein